VIPKEDEVVVTSVTAGSWNIADVKALRADVNVRALETSIADVVCRLTARITSVASTQS